MTPRERVLQAVNHQLPDRVPIDLGGLKASGIAVSAYDRVKRKLGIQTPTKVLDPRFMIAVVEDAVLERLHVDVVPLDLSIILNLIRPDSEWIPRRLFDGTQTLFPLGTNIAEDAEGNWILCNADGSPTAYQMPKNGYYFDDTSFNQGDRIDPQKFRPVSDIPDEHLKMLSHYARSLYKNTDYAILGWGFGVCFLGLSLITDRASNVTQGLPDQWMMMLLTEKETCHEMMGRAARHKGFAAVEVLSECVHFNRGSMDDAVPRRGGKFEPVPADHDPGDFLSACRLAEAPWPGLFGVYYQSHRPTKAELEAELGAGIRKPWADADDRAILADSLRRFQ